MGQILCHLWGDYILQSDWMAQNKTKDSMAAFIHAGIYTALFLLFTRSIPALAVIFFTHAAIDRFRLARYVVWAKNWMGARRPWFKTANGWTDKDEGTDYRAGTWPTPPFSACAATGYPPTTPAWLAFWLLIIADNTLHLTINFLAIKYL